MEDTTDFMSVEFQFQTNKQRSSVRRYHGLHVRGVSVSQLLCWLVTLDVFTYMRGFSLSALETPVGGLG